MEAELCQAKEMTISDKVTIITVRYWVCNIKISIIPSNEGKGNRSIQYNIYFIGFKLVINLKLV